MHASVMQRAFYIGEEFGTACSANLVQPADRRRFRRRRAQTQLSAVLHREGGRRFLDLQVNNNFS